MSARPPMLGSGLQELAMQATVCLAQFLSQASIAMSLSTMNIILSSFSALEGKTIPDSRKIWFMGSYALTLGTFILVSGRLGDLFGLRKMFVFGWFWAAFWALVSGLAYYTKSLEFFILCRALEGIGFAFILPCGMGILGTIYPNGQRKNFAFAFVGAAAPTGATVGCIMAAVVAQLWFWCWAFYLLAIACAILGCISLYAIPDKFKHHDYTVREAFARFDLLGSSLGVAGLILFNFVWNQGPVAGWNLAYVIVLLVASVLLLVAFFVVELKYARYPLLPREIFDFRIGLVLLCMSLGWGLFGVWQYYYWSLMMNLRGYTPIQTGFTYVPLLILGILASILVGRFMSRRRAPYIICASMVGFMMGVTLLALIPVHQTFWRLTFGQMFLLAWGMDCSFPAASLTLSDFLHEHHQGMAGSLVNTVVNYSVSLFLAISSTVEVEVKEKTGDTLRSYRSAVYLGVGISALAVMASVVLIITEHKRGDTVETDYEPENEKEED